MERIYYLVYENFAENLSNLTAIFYDKADAENFAKHKEETSRFGWKYFIEETDKIVIY